MPFHITCPCGRLTVVPDDAAGEIIQCSRCHTEIEVPEVDAPEPPRVPVSEEQPIIVINTDSSLLPGPAVDPSLLTVRLLAVGIAVLALLDVFPVVVAARQGWGEPPTQWIDAHMLEPWAMAVILVAILHLVYMVYLLQLPDYSCVRVVSCFLLVISTAYAIVLGVRLLAPSSNRIMTSLALERNPFSSQQESLWCFLMMTLTGVLSYLAGRAASQWRARLMCDPKGGL
ncbi:MAG: hypothetical protein ACODAD_16205 [Planctomycetota bacterium]